jgi:type IV fimbrial biogenesis protein FimT
MVHAMDLKTSPRRAAARLLTRSPAGGGRPAGFTLTELVFTLTIAAILVSIGVPSFKTVTNTNRIASEINGLLGDMQFARAEAIKEGRTVTICSSTDRATCAGSTTWNTGWIVFQDPNSSQTVNAGDNLLRVQSALGTGDTLVADNTIKAVSFNREGFALGLPGTVTLKLHDATSNSSWTRCLQVSIVGQLQTEKSGTGNCT